MTFTLLAPMSETLAADSISPFKPIVAREKPVDTLANFFAAIDESSSGSSSVFRRIFGGSKTAAAPKIPVVPDQPESRVRILMAADVDPRFEQWQKDADERLKQEKSHAVVKQHPFAAANPDKSVVVCEAGCRTLKDEIVYIAAVVPAVLPVAPSGGQFEPSSSNGGPDPSAQGLEEGELPCIAGCYDRPTRRSDTARRTAERREPPARPATAERRLAIAKAHAPEASLIQTAVIYPVEQSVERPQAAGFAARIRSRLQVGHNGAIVEQRPNNNLKLAQSEHASPAREASEIYQTWRTKIVFARGHELNRSLVLRALRQSRHGDDAVAQTRFARRY